MRQRRPVVQRELCKGCGKCVAACPKQLLRMSREINQRGYHYAVYAGDGCVGCGNCYYSCPESEAIIIVERCDDGPDAKKA